jgi:hypothetical protein
MGELTTDATPGGSTPALLRRPRASRTTPATTRSDAPRSFSATGTGGRRDSRVATGRARRRPDDMPSVVEQRNDLARFGVGILDFKHPALEGAATWEQRFGRSFETLEVGDVLVVVSERARGQTSDEVAPTIRTLRRHTSWSRC